MANFCDFELKLKGTAEDIQAFYDALSQAGKTWMGRGADAYLCFGDKDPERDQYIATIGGACKWSVKDALINDAISMKKQKDGGPHTWADIDDVDEFLTVWDACKKYNLEMEGYSREDEGGMFEEYIAYLDGEEYYETIDLNEEDGFDRVYTF